MAQPILLATGAQVRSLSLRSRLWEFSELYGAAYLGGHWMLSAEADAEWIQALQDIPVGSCTLGSLALHLREVLPRMPCSHLGSIAKTLSTLTHWDFGKLHAESQKHNCGLLPLPMMQLSAEDLTNCYQERKGKVRQVIQQYWAHTSSTSSRGRRVN